MLLTQRPKRPHQPIYTAEGFKFTETNAWPWSKITVAIFILISLSFFALFFWNIMFCIVPLVIIFAFFLPNIITRIRLKPGEIILPTYPLQLGGHYQIRYRRQLRRGATLQAGTITAKWLSYEWVKYNRGSTVKTKTETYRETTLLSTHIDPGATQVECVAQIELRRDDPPSITLDTNQLRWELQISTSWPGLPQTTSSFRLHVLPEVLK